MDVKLMFLLLASAEVWAQTSMHPDILSTSFVVTKSELIPDYWKERAQKKIEEKTDIPLNKNVAKNVIMFLGDSMSLLSVAAAQAFPYVGLSKTDPVDSRVADSANTATAYLCGVKAKYGTIGVGPEVARSDCKAQANISNHVHSIAYSSQLKNKSTGLVTTARVTHASPAGVYAHTADKNWESDKDILNARLNPLVCPDIAMQLVVGETGENLDVILGGGKAEFLPQVVEDEEGSYGERSDGINLIAAWLNVRRKNAAYVWNRSELLNLNENVDHLLGLFSSSHMDYNFNRNTALKPSLAEMTEAAIKILSRGQNGYFLFVEGVKIDMAHHATEARIALDKRIEFSKAVQTAVNLSNEENTLIVVISDRSLTSEIHGGDDVAIYARGPWAHLLSGVLEQNDIHHTMSYASCVGMGELNACSTKKNSAEIVTFSLVVIILLHLLI